MRTAFGLMLASVVTAVVMVAIWFFTVSPRIVAACHSGGDRVSRSQAAQNTPNCRAMPFMDLASSMSNRVRPPASWVVSTTSTVL